MVTGGETQKLSGGKIAAAVIFSVLGAVALVAAIVAFILYRRRKT